MDWGWKAPIHDAADRGDAEALRRLLAEGVSPVATDYFAGTPLHCLCKSSRKATGDLAACIKLLLDAGANLEAVDSDRWTPLHRAANFANVEIMSLLVEAGAKVNAVTVVGWRPLHYAALWSGTVDCVEVLLAAGADIDARDNYGRTPFDIALANDKRRMWPVFLRAGAEIPNSSRPYIVRVRNAGGWKKYEQQHLARITAILTPTPRLPPEMVRKILEFWLHAGYY
jgi:ankyrin repeat protein